MKNDSRLKNSHIYAIKRLFCVAIAILVLAVSFPVFATSSNGIEFDTQPLTNTSTIVNYGSSTLSITPNGEVYVFLASTSRSPSFYDMFIYYLPGSSYVLNQQLTYQGSSGTLITDNGTYNYDYYYRVSLGTPQVPYYTEVNQSVAINNAISDLTDYINNYTPPEPPVTGKPLNYTLPAGNIAYLEIDSSLFNGVNLATIMPELSGVGSGDPWSLSSQFFAMTDDMLTNGASVYELNGTRIVWNKSPNASTNLLGQTDHAVWESQGPYPNKTYFVICNPFYFFDNENNSSITIVANGIKNVYVQPLKTVVQQNGNEISYNTTVDGGTYEGEVTDDLGPIEWTDPDGGNTAPGTSTSNTPVTGINQFQQWLQRILQQIISVFEPAHDAITTLASAVQNFSGWLKALYVWLPSPVLNLLTSAISLAIIIGVIKVFI